MQVMFLLMDSPLIINNYNTELYVALVLEFYYHPRREIPSRQPPQGVLAQTQK